MKTEVQDLALLRGIAEGDNIIITKVYRENFGLIHHFVTKNNGNYDDAMDVFQEAMLVVFEKSKQSDFELTCQLKTYIFSIGRRLWLKKLQRSNKWLAQTEEVEDAVPVEEEIEEKEKLDMDFAHMEQALLNLGEPCKSLLEAYYFEKKQMVDIASHFGYTNADNAKNQKYKCLVRLKKLFFSQYKSSE